MKTLWTKGLEADAVKEMTLHFKSGVQLRKRLSSLCQEKMEAKDRVCMQESEYDSANWAYKQADAQGYKRALKEIISLLKE